MSTKGWCGAAVGLVIASATTVVIAQPAVSPRDAETRAVAFLIREVPRWRAEHPCYSCHNNGDAARALLAARQRGHRIEGALDGTLEWLTHPERWDANKADGGFLDKPLAHIQFAGGLTSAHEAKIPAASAALATAADLVAADQKADGAWRLDTSQGMGSPVTYGTALVTWAALRTLRAAGGGRFSAAIARADRWIRGVEVASVLDAAAVALALGDADDRPASAQRERCLGILRRGQAPDGGWGPYVTSAPEPFDTAVALLALQTVEARRASEPATGVNPADGRPKPGTTTEGTETAGMIDRGRRFLIARQLEDGSWPETTRPPNQESYAQRISTTAWALIALMETSPR